MLAQAPLLALLLVAADATEMEELRLTVAVVRDPELAPLAPASVEQALARASQEFAQRFHVAPPSFGVTNEYSLAGFLGAYALPVDPACKPMYEARYRGGGASEVERFRPQALRFLERWPLESLAGFIEEPRRAAIKTHQDIFAEYAARYVRTVDAMRGLTTPAGTPLVEPERSARRSFVAWTCALLRQRAYDVVLTNSFILADNLAEPHPHSVFGKAKIGGIATTSPERAALGGQALLATSFAIDTELPQFAELPAGADAELRAQALGTYLLAHEIAHAVFGMPDFYDHPPGCLMTSRPGASYADGLHELAEHPAPCPRCRPYVEVRSLTDRARRLLAEKRYLAAASAAMNAINKAPKQYHGSRKKRLAGIMAIAAQAYAGAGREKQARSVAQAARDLDPNLPGLEAWLAPSGVAASSVRALPTSSTATVTRR